MTDAVDDSPGRVPRAKPPVRTSPPTRPARPPRAPRQRRQRSVQESLGSIVLGFESVIMFLATLVIFGLKALPWPVALGGGAALCVLLLATIPLLNRRAGFIMGWVLQVVILATALLVPLMLIVAALFGGMWAYCMIRGAKIDRENAVLRANAERDAAENQAPEHPSSLPTEES